MSRLYHHVGFRPRAFVLLLAIVGVGTGVLAHTSSEMTSTEYQYHHDHILGTSLDLRILARSETDADAVNGAILAEIERLRRIFSLYDPESELSRLNRATGPFTASPDLMNVLQQFDVMQAKSHGAFNGQLGELVRVWKEAESTQQEPDAETLHLIVEQLKKPGWVIDAKNRIVTRLSSQPLNLNSIAKGYIIDQACAVARTAVPTLSGLLLNLGGDMFAFGRETRDDVGWGLGIQDPLHPEDNARPLAVVQLRDRAIASSGNYERFYMIRGQRHSHIFDPRTGRSATGVASSTVIARNNQTANALATTLCVLSPKVGLDLISKTPGAECLIVASDGGTYRSSGFAQLERPLVEPIAFQADEKADQKAVSNPWPKDYQVTIDLTLPPLESKRYRRPYVAVWFEDQAGKPVRTITVWGNNPRWIREVSQWWRFAGENPALVKSVSRATRAPGHYSLVWDGKDDAGKLLPLGKYTIKVEVHREHGKHVTQTGQLECGAEPVSLSLTENAETRETKIEYGKKQK